MISKRELLKNLMGKAVDIREEEFGIGIYAGVDSSCRITEVGEDMFEVEWGLPGKIYYSIDKIWIVDLTNIEP